jgi:pimeloyl-ACP methyl ester carboxylesterase
VAVDLPGHGLRAGEAFGMARAVDAVRRAIDEAADGRAIVVGLSLGGYVALDLVASAPDRVAGLALAGTTYDPVGALGAAPFRAFGTVLRLVPRSVVDGFNDVLFRVRYPPRVAAELALGGYWPRSGSAALDALAGRRFSRRLASYPGPVLAINGRFDVVFRPGASAFLQPARDARRVVLDGAAHLSNLDAPDAFNAAVAALAERVTASGGSLHAGVGPRTDRAPMVD